MNSEPNYDEIRQRIKRKYDNRTEFLGNLVSFLGANFVVWGVIQPQYLFATIAAFIMGCWFIGVLVHAVVAWGKEAQERAIEREIERERAWRRQAPSDADVKRKRERLQLTNDGEILAVVSDDDDEQQARQ